MVVSAPVGYDPKDFIIYLFSKLCERVAGNAAATPSIAAEFRRHLEELRYLRTFTSDWSNSMQPIPSVGIARKQAKERAEQPLTLPKLVDDFRAYSARVADWQRSAVNEKGRVVIGIDELDKIQDSVHAEHFLNDIKSIFGVRGCLYIVSLSEDALAVFSQRTPKSGVPSTARSTRSSPWTR